MAAISPESILPPRKFRLTSVALPVFQLQVSSKIRLRKVVGCGLHLVRPSRLDGKYDHRGMLRETTTLLTAIV